MSKLKIATTGLNGLVGSRINELLANDFDFINLNQEIMDITNIEIVNKIIKDTDFDLFLHLAAYTNVDGAEKNRELAWNINVKGTKNIFQAITEKNKKMIYISTDFVFDGIHSPFDENSSPNPKTYYGETKYQGELVVKDNAMIVRFSYPYRTAFNNKTDLVRSIINILANKQKINGVIDQIITPTYIDDIAFGLKYLINNYTTEIFHLVGSESLSGYDLIQKICHYFKLKNNLVGKINYDQFYQGRAKRPKNGTIISSKNNFQPMKNLDEGLLKF